MTNEGKKRFILTFCVSAIAGSPLLANKNLKPLTTGMAVNLLLLKNEGVEGGACFYDVERGHICLANVSPTVC